MEHQRTLPSSLLEGGMSDERAVGMVESKLQLALKSPLARVTGLWCALEPFTCTRWPHCCHHRAISNPRATLAFQRRCEGLLQVDAWVDVGEIRDGGDLLGTRTTCSLTAATAGLDQICTDGFQVHATEGHIFSTSISNGTCREAILCSVGVGSALVVDQSELPELAGQLEHGYDSHLVLGESSKSPPAEYRYCVYDSAQVMPRWLVRWDLSRHNNSSSAMEAEEEEVRSLEQVLASLNPNSIAARELQASIQVSRTKISEVKVLYQQAYEASGQTDSSSVRHKNKLEALVSSLAANAEQVNQNATEVEEELFSAVQNALSELQRITQGKLQHLLSCEMEVRRQLQEMEAAEELLGAQRTQMEPLQFCEAWTRHQALRDQLRKSRLPLVDSSIENPIRVQGGISPICEGTAKKEEHRPTQELDVEPYGSSATLVRSQYQEMPTVEDQSATHPQDLDPSLKLSTLSHSHRRSVIELGIVLKPCTPFTGSTILDGQLASVLFYAIGFCDEPDTNLLYSTERDGFSMEQFHSSCDGVGPTALVARVGEYVFGGYAGTSWNRNATRFGTPKSFIFNLAPYDVKIGISASRCPSAFRCSQPLHVSCQDDFRSCVSEIENSYSARLHSEDARICSLVSGAHVTTPDVVEVWGFTH